MAVSNNTCDKKGSIWQNIRIQKIQRAMPGSRAEFKFSSNLDILFGFSGPDACFSFFHRKNLRKLFARPGRQARAESSREKMAAA
jgi:hypothetical protein